MVQRGKKLGRESRRDEDFNDRVTVPKLCLRAFLLAWFCLTPPDFDKFIKFSEYKRLGVISEGWKMEENGLKSTQNPVSPGDVSVRFRPPAPYISRLLSRSPFGIHYYQAFWVLPSFKPSPIDWLHSSSNSWNSLPSSFTSLQAVPQGPRKSLSFRRSLRKKPQDSLEICIH